MDEWEQARDEWEAHRAAQRTAMETKVAAVAEARRQVVPLDSRISEFVRTVLTAGQWPIRTRETAEEHQGLFRKKIISSTIVERCTMSFRAEANRAHGSDLCLELMIEADRCWELHEAERGDWGTYVSCPIIRGYAGGRIETIECKLNGHPRQFAYDLQVFRTCIMNLVKEMGKYLLDHNLPLPSK